MNKWIAKFDLEDGDTMPEHMDLEYKGARIDFHCRPLEQEPILDKIRSEIEQTSETVDGFLMHDGTKRTVLQILDKYKAESEGKE